MSKHSKRVRRNAPTTKNNHGGRRDPAKAAERMLRSSRGFLTAKERQRL